MGDFRASVKIKFDMGSVSEETEFWINWWPDDDTGVDRRVTEWLASVGARGVESIRDSIDGYLEEQAEKARIKRIAVLRQELVEIDPAYSRPYEMVGKARDKR